MNEMAGSDRTSTGVASPRGERSGTVIAEARPRQLVTSLTWEWGACFGVQFQRSSLLKSGVSLLRRRQTVGKVSP